MTRPQTGNHRLVAAALPEGQSRTSAKDQIIAVKTKLNPLPTPGFAPTLLNCWIPPHWRVAFA
jgi:hypothetical protein